MMSDRATVVAVIGGGASGTLAAIYLLREVAAARVPLRIAIIDRNGRHGLGQAYATSNAAHLLNSRADRMSAVAGDPGHLVRWAVHRGHVVAVTEALGGLRVRVEQDGRTAEIAARWLINATGPATDITATQDPLLRGLLHAGLATPDPLRLGLQAAADGALLDVSGRPSGTLFTLGPPLRGQLYETTAVPEIRDQAAALAIRLISACRSRTAETAA